MVPGLTSHADIKPNSNASLLPSQSTIRFDHRKLPPPGLTPRRSRRAKIFGAAVRSRCEADVRKLALLVFGVCVWVALLAAVVTTVARLGTEAKERRAQSIAEHLSKSKR